MVRVFLFHGAYGDPENNWFPWLRDALCEKGCEVLIPAFPTPEGQSLENWRAAFEEYWEQFDDPNERIIVVAHSLAPAFVLDLLERAEHPVFACFFVAGFLGALGKEPFDDINASFTVRDFDWEKIDDSCDYVYVYGSDDDPYVPFEKVEELADKLETHARLVKGAGHFNTDAGCTDAPFLLDELEKII